MKNRYPQNAHGYLSIYKVILESELLEEVVALVIHEDECREVLDLNLPDSLHSELRVLYTFDALDVVLSEDCGRASDGSEIESAVLLAGISHALSAITLSEHDHAASVALEEVNV